MNKYFALRKTNRMRTELLTEKSQEQLKEVIRYLRRVSWDFCGIELVRSDLLDIAIQATRKSGTVSFDFGRKDLCGRGQAKLENTESRRLLLVCCTAVFLFWVGRGRLAALSGNWKLGF